MGETFEMTEDTFVEEFDDTSTFENKAGLAEVREKDMKYSTAVSYI